MRDKKRDVRNWRLCGHCGKNVYLRDQKKKSGNGRKGEEMR